MVIMVLALSGCISLPAPKAIVQQPMSTRTGLGGPPPANGAIFQAGTYDRPLFEDRRARVVGDTLVIVLNERWDQIVANNRFNAAPNLVIEITEDRADRLIETLKDGRFDLVVGPIYGEFIEPNLDETFLFNSQLVVVTRPGHPLGARRSVKLSDLKPQVDQIPAGDKAFIKEGDWAASTFKDKVVQIPFQ